MVVLVEGGGEGHSTAVPVTKEVYKWYFGERSR
jgi:cell division protein FtsI/penicillin-binding protein 2